MVYGMDILLSFFFFLSFTYIHHCKLAYSSSQTENGHSVLKSDYE